MADLGNFSTTLSNIGTSGVGVAIILVIALFFLGVILFAFIYLPKARRYSQYVCTVWERDGFGQLREKHDTAGIFIDSKTKNKRFFLRKANVGLSPDDIPYIPDTVRGPFGGPKPIKRVYLNQTGLKNFRFIRPDISENPGIRLQVTEEDVNWALNSYTRGKILFAKKSLLDYMPFIMMAFVTIIILVIFIYFFKNFTVLKEASEALKEASRNLADAKSGTTVIQGIGVLLSSRWLKRR